MSKFIKEISIVFLFAVSSAAIAQSFSEKQSYITFGFGISEPWFDTGGNYTTGFMQQYSYQCQLSKMSNQWNIGFNYSLSGYFNRNTKQNAHKISAATINLINQSKLSGIDFVFYGGGGLGWFRWGDWIAGENTQIYDDQRKICWRFGTGFHLPLNASVAVQLKFDGLYSQLHGVTYSILHPDGSQTEMEDFETVNATERTHLSASVIINFLFKVTAF